jgi:hypothetical protein
LPTFLRDDGQKKCLQRTRLNGGCEGKPASEEEIFEHFSVLPARISVERPKARFQALPEGDAAEERK